VADLGLDASTIRRSREGGHLPFTRRAKKALELALRWATAMRLHHIGTEHVLLGLATERDGIAAKILHAHGIDATRLRLAIEDDAARGDAAS
jgi:ATP-dependent Clp protease ATP-binding subunit ClpA